MVTTTKTFLDDTTVIQATQFPIKSVKLFHSGGAEITRTFPLSFLRSQDDPQVVKIVNLPAHLDSVNVSVSSTSGNVTILDHYYTSDTSQPIDGSKITSQTLHELEKERQKLDDEKQFRRHNVALLKTYADAIAQCKSQNQADAAEMVSFFDNFVEMGTTRSAVISELDDKLAGVDKRIREETERLTKLRDELPTNVIVVLSCMSQVLVEGSEITVSYSVKQVSWKPTYDLHIAMEGDTPSQTVKLDFRCSVTQWTGENWENVGLALTTADQVSQLIEVPEPKRVDVRLGMAYVPPVMPTEIHQHMAYHMPPPRAPMPAQPMVPLPPPAQAVRRSALMSAKLPQGSQPVQGRAVESPFEHERPRLQKEFVDVDGDIEQQAGSQTVSQLISQGSKDPITHIANGSLFIPSDRAAHNVLVTSLPLQAEFMRVAIPSIDTRVYYTCEVKNTSEHVLLPGKVKTFLNKKHVSSTEIHSTDLPQILECCLAVDTGIKTIHSRAPDALPSVGAFTGKTTTTYTNAIVLQNTRADSVRGVIVRTSIPLPADPRITIVLKEPAGLADIDQGNVNVREGCLARWSTTGGRKGKEVGLFEWVCDVKPGTEVLKAMWEVCAPKDLKLFEQVRE